jgi:hypothetical protein
MRRETAKEAAKRIFDEFVESTPRLKTERERREKNLRNLCRKRSQIDAAIDAASQPEKDANNG